MPVKPHVVVFVVTCLALGAGFASAGVVPVQARSLVAWDFTDAGGTTVWGNQIKIWNNVATGGDTVPYGAWSPYGVFDGHAANQSISAGTNSVYTDAYIHGVWDVGLNMPGTFTATNRYMITFDASAGETVSIVGKLRAVADTRFGHPDHESTVEQYTRVYLKNITTGNLVWLNDLTAFAADETRSLQTLNVNSGTLSLATAGRYRIVMDSLQTLISPNAANYNPQPYIEAGTDMALLPNWRTWELTINGVPATPPKSTPEPAAAAMLLAGLLALPRRRHRAA